MNKQQFLDLGLTEDQAKKAEVESKKELETYVPKTRFDEVNNSKKELEKTVKERDTQLNDLKSKTGDNGELKKQIETLQADNKKKDDDYQAQIKEMQISSAIKLAIADKAQDADLVTGLFDKSKLILGDDGKVTGLEEQLKTIKEGKPFLFKTEDIQQQTNPQFKGMEPSNSNKDNLPNPNNPQNQTPSIKGALTALLNKE
ncbi:hypothetical protein FDF11_08245 [Clostridium botulinum]|nr:hypothetical protein [Clostridium botulinum]NFR13709.1 hypothetical protein [Clostridium botulinum]NFR42224.1 hypothetical protein [Clostridium botulinum]NFS50664.1 hypothetical protein [Clostridium botulinum]